MGDATRKLTDRLHFLGVHQLLLQQLALCYVYVHSYYAHSIARVVINDLTPPFDPTDIALRRDNSELYLRHDSRFEGA